MSTSLSLMCLMIARRQQGQDFSMTLFCRVLENVQNRTKTVGPRGSQRSEAQHVKLGGVLTVPEGSFVVSRKKEGASCLSIET